MTLSASGQQMIDSIAVARRRLMNQVLAQWPEDEVQALFRLTRKYADSLQQPAILVCCRLAQQSAFASQLTGQFVDVVGKYLQQGSHIESVVS